jgi:hypothetical protein
MLFNKLSSFPTFPHRIVFCGNIVEDSHNFHADPDPTFHVDTNPDPDPAFHDRFLLGV